MLIVAIMGLAVLFMAVNEGIFPEPVALRPIPGVEFVQLYPVPVPFKVMAVETEPLQRTTFDGAVTEGVGLTVILKIVVEPLQDIPPPVYTEVTVTDPEMGEVVEFVTTNGAILPVPEEFKPMLVLLFNHV